MTETTSKAKEIKEVERDGRRRSRTTRVPTLGETEGEAMKHKGRGETAQRERGDSTKKMRLSRTNPHDMSCRIPEWGISLFQQEQHLLLLLLLLLLNANGRPLSPFHQEQRWPLYYRLSPHCCLLAAHLPHQQQQQRQQQLLLLLRVLDQPL